MNRAVVRASATLRAAGGVRKYVSSRRVRVVVAVPLGCGAIAVCKRGVATDKCISISTLVSYRC